MKGPANILKAKKAGRKHSLPAGLFDVPNR